MTFTSVGLALLRKFLIESQADPDLRRPGYTLDDLSPGIWAQPEDIRRILSAWEHQGLIYSQMAPGPPVRRPGVPAAVRLYYIRDLGVAEGWRALEETLRDSRTPLPARPMLPRLPPATLALLQEVQQGRPRTVSELARDVQKNPGTVSRLLDTLEASRLVEIRRAHSAGKSSTVFMITSRGTEVIGREVSRALARSGSQELA